MIVVAAVLVFLVAAAAGIFWTIRRDDARRALRRPARPAPADAGDISTSAVVGAYMVSDDGCGAGAGGGGDCGGGD